MIYFVTNQTSISTENYLVSNKQSVLDYFQNKEEIGTDSETTGFEPHSDKLLSLQLGDRENQFVIDVQSVGINWLKELLENKLLILQNAKFDLRFLYKYNIFPNFVYDTYLAEKVLTQGLKSRYSLDYLAQKYCGQTLDKTTRGVIHAEGLSDRVIIYAANDTIHLSEIKKKQLIKAEEQELLEAIRLENEYSLVLAYIEFCGIKLDVGKWTEKFNEDTKELAQKEELLNALVIKNPLLSNKYASKQLDLFTGETSGVNINWASSKQVIPLMKSLGVNTKIIDKKTGKIKDSLEANYLAPQKNLSPIISAYLEYKEKEKEVSTYGENWLKQINTNTGRIHTSFNQIMNTSRTSCGGKDKFLRINKVNLQNLPADNRTRNCLVPEKGNVFVDCDYTAMEDVVFTNKSKERALIAFYSDLSTNRDGHSYIAKLCFSEELKDIAEEDVKKVRPDLRQKGKVGKFSILFGGNGSTIARNLNIPESEGYAVEEAYFKAFPDSKKYFDEQEKLTLKNGYVLINEFTGRKYYPPYFKQFIEIKNSINWDEYKLEKAKNSEKFHNYWKPLISQFAKMKGKLRRESLNFPIQGQAAEISKIAGIYLFREIKKRNWLNIVKIVVFVHDQYILECPEHLAQEVASMTQECMEKAASLFCKIVPIKAEPIITNCWKK